MSDTRDRRTNTSYFARVALAPTLPPHAPPLLFTQFVFEMLLDTTSTPSICNVTSFTFEMLVLNTVKFRPAGTRTVRSVEDAFAAKIAFSIAALFTVAVASEESPEIAPNSRMSAQAHKESNPARILKPRFNIPW